MDGAFGRGELARLEAADRANQYLYQVMDIGQAMLQSGGEVSRVEDSIRRQCMAYGAQRADVFSITSNIEVTMYGPGFGAITQTRRVIGQQTDLYRLELLNQLSRRICQERLTAEEMAAALKEIQATPQYPFPVQVFTYALVSASFCVFFGGTAADAAVSGLIGVVLKFLDRAIRRVQPNAFLSALLCSCLGGLLASAAVRYGLGQNLDMINIGNIMLLIPGLALTNSLRDMFSGDTLSGLMRFLEAILLALTLALGFALVTAAV